MTDPRDLQVETRYRDAAREEPAPALDAAILAAARRAIGAGPVSLARRSRPVWMLPLAAAAVLVISVTVLRLAPQEEVVPAMQAAREAPMAESTAAPPAKPQPLADKAAALNAASPPLMQAAPAASPGPVSRRAITPSEEPKRAGPASEEREAKRERLAAEPAETSRAAAATTAGAAPPASAPAPAPAPASAALSARSAPAALAPPAPPAMQLAEQAPAGRRDTSVGETTVAEARKEKSAQEGKLSAPRQAAEPQDARAPVLRQGLGAGSAAADTQPLPPEAWIAKLLTLQAAGREAEFLAELAAFRRAYPQYPLPPALEAALVRLPAEAPRPFPGQTPR